MDIQHNQQSSFINSTVHVMCILLQTNMLMWSIDLVWEMLHLSNINLKYCFVAKARRRYLTAPYFTELSAQWHSYYFNQFYQSKQQGNPVPGQDSVTSWVRLFFQLECVVSVGLYNNQWDGKEFVSVYNKNFHGGSGYKWIRQISFLWKVSLEKLYMTGLHLMPVHRLFCLG